MSRAMTGREFGLMLACVAAGLLTLVSWSGYRLTSAKDAAAESARGLAECHRHATNIEILRKGPAAAGATEPAAGDLNRRVERAAQSAGLPRGAVARIDPEPARRVGDTPYRESPTQVRLRRVTLRQLFTFLHALGARDGAAGSAGLQVRALRLTAPRGLESGSAWDVDSTLTYLVYDPAGGRRGGPPANDSTEPVAAR